MLIKNQTNKHLASMLKLAGGRATPSKLPSTATKTPPKPEKSQGPGNANLDCAKNLQAGASNRPQMGHWDGSWQLCACHDCERQPKCGFKSCERTPCSLLPEAILCEGGWKAHSLLSFCLIGALEFNLDTSAPQPCIMVAAILKHPHRLGLQMVWLRLHGLWGCQCSYLARCRDVIIMTCTYFTTYTSLGGMLKKVQQLLFVTLSK